MHAGSATDPHTEFGPQASATHRERLQGLQDRLASAPGASVRTAALEGPGEVAFFPPALVVAAADIEVEEIFGPLATVQGFADPMEAVSIANTSPLLQSYVFGREPLQALRLGERLRCGSVMVNGVGFQFEGVQTAEGVPEALPIGFFSGSGLGVEDGVLGAARFFTGPASV